MSWAIGAGHRTDDPTPAAVAALPNTRNGKQHHAAVAHGDLGALLADIRVNGAPPAARLAFEMLALTAVRSNEVRSMTWAEVDADAAVWTIPAARTKTGKAHRVPLSTRALEVLAVARTLGTGDGLVFAGRTGAPITNDAVRRLLNGKATLHGLRSTFRDWCSERSIPGEVAEQALGHVVKGTEGAYRRTDLLDARRPLMADWAAYLGVNMSRLD